MLSLGITLYFDIARQSQSIDSTISSTAAYVASMDGVAEMLANGYPTQEVTGSLDSLHQNFPGIDIIAVYDRNGLRFYHTSRLETGETFVAGEETAILSGSPALYHHRLRHPRQPAGGFPCGPGRVWLHHRLCHRGHLPGRHSPAQPQSRAALLSGAGRHVRCGPSARPWNRPSAEGLPPRAPPQGTAGPLPTAGRPAQLHRGRPGGHRPAGAGGLCQRPGPDPAPVRLHPPGGTAR